MQLRTFQIIPFGCMKNDRSIVEGMAISYIADD